LNSDRRLNPAPVFLCVSNAHAKKHLGLRVKSLGAFHIDRMASGKVGDGDLGM
jgi:hypothetical protein